MFGSISLAYNACNPLTAPNCCILLLCFSRILLQPFLHSSVFHQLRLLSFVDLFRVCCSLLQRFLSFSGHSKLLCKLSPQCLCNGSDIFSLFSKLQNGLLFSQRQLSGLHVDLSFLAQMQSSQAKTNSRHSELFIVQPINLTGHTWEARCTRQSVPTLLVA